MTSSAIFAVRRKVIALPSIAVRTCSGSSALAGSRVCAAGAEETTNPSKRPYSVTTFSMPALTEASSEASMESSLLREATSGMAPSDFSTFTTSAPMVPLPPRTSITRSCSCKSILLHLHEAAQEVADLPRAKGFFNIVDADTLRNELAQREASLQVQIHIGWEVSLWQAVAVPCWAQRAAAAVEINGWDINAGGEVWHAHH